MNIIEKICSAMFDDDDDSREQSEILLETYKNSTCKKDIDDIMICLCGYSIDSLMTGDILTERSFSVK